MDLLRIFIETAFARYPIDKQSGHDRQLLNEQMFIDTVKCFHPELSDDHLRLLFNLYKDVWSKGPAEPNIFYSLVPFVTDVISIESKIPYIKIEHLLRWRELTQMIGEDMLICAALAFCDIYTDRERSFDWPSVLSSDIFDLHFNSQKGLAELHHHLKASTDIFSISWLCLMNHVRGRMGCFKAICHSIEEADKLYCDYIEAVAIRIELSRYILHCEGNFSLANIQRRKWLCKFGNIDELENEICRLSKFNYVKYDYLRNNANLSPDSCIYASERWLVYSVLKRIYEGDDNELIVSLMWRYVVIKNQLRKKLVQNNENVGFGNFAEFETRKEVFLERYPLYADLLIGNPVAEAAKHHYVKYLETRISPSFPQSNLCKKLNKIQKLIDKHLNQEKVGADFDYKVIYHFIKKKDRQSTNCRFPRNYRVRCEVKKQAIAIKGMMEKYKKSKNLVVGIDAANSEFNCRPEVFAHAYRYLNNTGLRYTFHVGEDFYDLADGLRAIDEAVFFLHLRRGDRLGHCLALGLDAKKYYSERHYTVPIPRQNLLDNLIWLYFKAKSYNITIAPCVEIMIQEKFSELSKVYRRDEGLFTMIDYYHAMRLRGNNPLGREDKNYGFILDYWDAYDLDKELKQYSENEMKVLENLFWQYHFGKEVREEGEKVCEFKVDEEYVRLIFLIQEKMMDDIENKGIAIECCPSSNYRIGRLCRYDNHPLFRMHEVDPNGEHHLPVTINTDDLGIFTTSLDNEYSLILSALIKKKDLSGRPLYNNLYIQTWIERIIRNGHKYSFSK